MVDFTITDIAFIIIIHFFADFVVQTYRQSIEKSDLYKWGLYGHILSYSVVWTIALIFYSSNIVGGLVGGLLIGIMHLTTDAITAKGVKYYFDKKDYHNGFVVIGVDQVLHYAQLFLILYALKEGNLG